MVKQIEFTKGHGTGNDFVLVLDADALNAIAQDSSLQTLLVRRASTGLPTVLTPHPLEAARLLGCTLAQVQSDRCAAAQRLAVRAADS